MNKGEKLKLIREPENKYDRLAIRINDSKGNKLGYIPRAKNEVLASLMDAGKLIYAVLDEKITDSYDVDIKVSVFMQDF